MRYDKKKHERGAGSYDGSCSLDGSRGLDGYEISVECYITNGLPGFDVVGLPDTAVKEARERVRAAIKNCGYKFPVSRITLNLAPAGTKRQVRSTIFRCSLAFWRPLDS